MSHTPGPWKYPSGNRISIIETNAPGLFPVVVARVFDQSDPVKYGDEISNAKLIAASPDLLRLIKQVLPDNMGGYPDLFHPDQGWENWEKEVLQVIAKIEGE